MLAENKKLDFTDPDIIAVSFLTNYIFDPEPESEKLPSSDSICYKLTSWKDDFYVWRDGCYIRLSDAEMQRMIAGYIQRLNSSGGQDEQIPITTQRINNIMLCLKGRIGRPETVDSNSWPDGRERLIFTIACKNGLVCWDKKKKIKPVLMKHTPKFFNVVKLPYDYEPAAECPLWLKFLSEVLQGQQDYILLLQQWTGYLFRPDLKEQKFLLCCGDGANGKGVLFEVIQSLVGKENCSQVSLSRFSSPFPLYNTLGKVLNATNESSHIIEDEAETILKSFVAGDTFTFERKFKEPVSAVPTAKIMISTNALPRFNDKTEGIWRRILLVPFNRVLGETELNKDLAEILKKEQPGILNWAIEGLQDLNDAGGFILPDNNKELLEDYRRETDPARAFLLENYQPSNNGDFVSCSELYDNYKRYCSENGCYAMNSKTFGQQVRRIFPKIERKRTGGRTSREWAYGGLVSYEKEDNLNDNTDSIPI